MPGWRSTSRPAAPPSLASPTSSRSTARTPTRSCRGSASRCSSGRSRPGGPRRRRPTARPSTPVRRPAWPSSTTRWREHELDALLAPAMAPPTPIDLVNGDPRLGRSERLQRAGRGADPDRADRSWPTGCRWRSASGVRAGARPPCSSWVRPSRPAATPRRAAPRADLPRLGEPRPVVRDEVVLCDPVSGTVSCTDLHPGWPRSGYGRGMSEPSTVRASSPPSTPPRTASPPRSAGSTTSRPPCRRTTTAGRSPTSPRTSARAR